MYKKLMKNIPCTTAQTPLPGYPVFGRDDLLKISREKAFPLETISYLADIYGSRLASVLTYVSEDSRWSRPITNGSPDRYCQIKHAVVEEEAMTVNDFLLRRSALGLSPNQGQDVVESVAQEMGILLGWDNQERQKQIREYSDSVAISQNFRKGVI